MIASNARVAWALQSTLMVLGVFALSLVWRVDLPFCERHMLKTFWMHEAAETKIVPGLRAGLVAVALLSFAALPRARRWALGQPEGAAAGVCTRNGLALVLALIAAEIGLRVLDLPPSILKKQKLEVRIGERDPRYGWTFSPSRTTRVAMAGRTVEYAIDAGGRRVRNADDRLDPGKPTILFAGESITVGHRLEWAETFPAQVGEALGVQVANLGVHGYGADQAFLRLYDALPSFERPVAIVSLYIAPMLARIAEDEHPRLSFIAENDVLTPVVAPRDGFWDTLRLARAWRAIVPYRDGHSFELAQLIYRETDRLARAHGAHAIFVAPRHGPRRDTYSIDELFVRQGLDVVDVDVGERAIDLHPDAAGTRAIADALIARLRRLAPLQARGPAGPLETGAAL